jgi:hypothetical protein
VVMVAALEDTYPDRVLLTYLLFQTSDSSSTIHRTRLRICHIDVIKCLLDVYRFLFISNHL